MKRCALLGMLALHAGQLVSTSRLIDALWEEAPPRSATSNLRTYVSELRRLLEEGSTGSVRLLSHPTGYRLEVDHDDLDLLRFERLIDQGEQAAREGRAERAVNLLEQADQLWRGTPCDGVELGAWARARVSAIEDRRWAAMSCLVDVKLGLGESAGLVPRLRGMLAERPLCERTWAQLMVALDRSGRKGEALETFARARQVLDVELGLEPGPELTELQQRILSSRQLPVRSVPANVARPRCLPPAVSLLAGRDAPLAELVRTLTSTSELVAAVSGPPGSGKTSLVVAAAHRLAANFPDGQLYHQLGGTAVPLRPADVLGEFLRSLGVAPAAIPRSVDERAAVYRSVLADRRVLVVLDDAADADQLRPLLPGAGGGRTLISSRTRLTSVEGAHRLHLSPLDDRSSTQMLADVAGPERVRREAGDAARIVQACAGSPLALRIAGARLATRPGLSLSALAQGLVGASTRLDELSLGELSLRAAFEPSYDRLSADARRVFGLLGLLGPHPVPASTIAALANGMPLRAEQVIEELVRTSLLTPGPGALGADLTYHLDSLLALYAAERVDVDRLVPSGPGSDRGRSHA